MNPTKVDRQEEAHGAIESAGAEIIRRVTRSEDPLRDELLWGIPNEITLDYIATLLPRRAYEAVAQLNPDWQRAFQGRMVYDARVRSQTTQTFLVVWCTVSTKSKYVKNLGVRIGDNTKIDKYILSLFSPSEERWYKLPPIPGFCNVGMLHNFKRVILDGSIYVLGGTKSWSHCKIPSADVCVLDLAGQPSEWRRCANMQAPRCSPEIGVLNGKIFVFGGFNLGGEGDYNLEYRNEVYDPKADAWSFIAPTLPSASIVSVFPVRQQFLACVGWNKRSSTRQHFLACVGWNKRSSTPEPVKPVIEEEDEIFRDTKFVVKIDDKGRPKVVSTTLEDDAEDDMDGLHEIIENQLVNPYKHVGRAEHFASTVRYHEQSDASESFFGFYDPAKNEWCAFDKECLGAEIDVDAVLGPKYLGSLNIIRGDDLWEADCGMASLWSMNM